MHVHVYNLKLKVSIQKGANPHFCECRASPQFYFRLGNKIEYKLSGSGVKVDNPNESGVKRNVIKRLFKICTKNKGIILSML